MGSWLQIDTESTFSLSNIPFGIINTADNLTPRPATILGEHVLDLKAFADNGGFKALDGNGSSLLKALSEPTLNSFARLGQKTHRAVRLYLQEIFKKNGQLSEVLEDKTSLQSKVLIPVKDVTTHLPMQIGDYTDFYAGRNHAHNSEYLVCSRLTQSDRKY
jgi:fumarylacetoacetase